MSKWISSSLVFPALKVMTQRPVKGVGSAVRQLNLALEVAVLGSGPLPLLTPILLLGMLTEVLLLAASWERRVLSEPIDSGSIDMESLALAQVYQDSQQHGMRAQYLPLPPPLTTWNRTSGGSHLPSSMNQTLI